MTAITVKELKALLADLSDDTVLTLNAEVDGDELGMYTWGVATLETEDKILLSTEG